MKQDLRQIKIKRPWGRMTSDSKFLHPIPVLDSISAAEAEVRPDRTLVTQADMLRQYYPSSHLINNEVYYPDIVREEEVQLTDANGNDLLNPDGTPQTVKRTYTEHVPRYAFAFQQIITTKQIVHLCGNDIQFDIANEESNDTKHDDVLRAFRIGWLKKDMEIAWYELAKSVKITGDGAIVGFISKGKFGWKSLSYKNGDTLYPHFDSITGKLTLFARAFSDYDETGAKLTDWVEVWDEQFLYRYKHDINNNQMVNVIKKIFGLDGFSLVSQERHGFNFIPVAYHRDEDGACWSMAQDSIDGYELAYSQMAHNNQAFGEPILYLQGDDIQPIHDTAGTVKTLAMGKDDKAGYLEGQSAADSYQKQLEINYNMILKQSFCVETPKISGNSDISGAALKVLYADAVEKATIDANDFQKAINDLVNIYAYGYGMEIERNTDFINLPVMPWIKPYVFVSESTVVNDLVQAVGSGFCSKQTASERISFYTEADEWERIIRENKEEQQADLLYQLKAQQQSNESQEGNNDKDQEPNT